MAGERHCDVVVDNPEMERAETAFSDSPVSWMALAFAGVLAMTIVTPIAAAGGVQAALTLGEVALAAPTLLGLALLQPRRTTWWSTTPFRLGEAFLSLTCGLALWVTSLGLFGMQATIWPPPPAYLEAFRALHEALRPDGPFTAAVSLAAVSLAPALGEEVVFRGPLLVSLGRRLGRPAAVVLTALAFGSIHVDLVGGAMMAHRVPFAILIGLGLATLRFRTGSLAAPMFAHATVNALTFGAVLFGLDDTAAQPSPAMGGAVVLLAGGGAALIALLRLRLTRDLPRPQRPM